MNYKKILSVIFVALFTSLVFSQNTVGTAAQIEAFYKTKTLVVYSSSPLAWFNGKIRDAMKKSWKLTEYDVIEAADFDSKMTDPQYSFLSIDQLVFNKDKKKTQYDFLCLTIGGDYKSLSDMPNLCSIPLSYSGVDDDTYIYKLNTFLKFMQNHVQLTKENPILSQTNIIRHYNKNTSSIKDKTLYLIGDELSNEVNTLEKISKIYPYKTKIVTRDELEKVIDAEEKDAVFLHKVGPDKKSQKGTRCYKIIIGADDAKIYYYDYHIISDKNANSILVKDFKTLGQK